MPKAVDWVFNRAVQLIAAWVVSVSLGAWQHFVKACTWPEIIVGSLAVFVLVAWSTKEFVHMPLRLRVRQWLDHSGFAVTTIPGDDFTFALTDNVRLTALITKRKDSNGIDIAIPGLKPSPDQAAVFKTWSSAQKEAFLRNIRMEFLRSGVQFTDLDLESGITLSERLVVNNHTTEVEFLRRLMFVRSSARLYLEILKDLSVSTEAIP